MSKTKKQTEIKEEELEVVNEIIQEPMDKANEVISQKLEDLEGIGDVRLKKLYTNNIFTVDDLLQHGEESLARMLDIPWEDARKMVMVANESLNTDEVFRSLMVDGRQYANYRKNRIKYCTTGLNEFDEILGGYETGVITEFFAGFGGGKTQFCMVASIMAQMPINACCLDCGTDLSIEPPIRPPKNYRPWLDKRIPKTCTKCNSERVWRGGGLSEYGKPCRVVYVDTENSYRDERVLEIVCNRGLVKTIEQSKTDIKKQAPKEPLNDEEYEKAMGFVERISISRPRTSAIQMMVVSNLNAIIDGELCKICHGRRISIKGDPTHIVEDEKVNEKARKNEIILQNHLFEKDIPAKMVIIDSITGKFRKEYEGRGTLSDRQMKLKSHVKILESVVEGKNVICIVTNQVGEKMDVMGDNIRPVGGNEIGHTFTHRIYLKKAQSMTKDKINAILVDSPNRAKNEIALELGANGVQPVTAE